MFLNRLVEKARLHFPPFRMAIGRFGIWLAEIGRAMQVKYANWNCDFRLVHELDANPRADRCNFHVSERVSQEPIISFGGVGHQEAKQTPMTRELLRLRGITGLYLHPYYIAVDKAKVFSWDELIPQVERIILKHLAAA